MPHGNTRREAAEKTVGIQSATGNRGSPHASLSSAQATNTQFILQFNKPERNLSCSTKVL